MSNDMNKDLGSGTIFPLGDVLPYYRNLESWGEILGFFVVYWIQPATWVAPELVDTYVYH